MRWMLITALLLETAAASAAPSHPISLRWDVRVRGHKVGQAKIDVGKPTRIGKKRVRPVEFTANVSPAGVSALSFEGKATTWAERTWAPVKTAWDWRELQHRATVEGTVKRGMLDAEYVLNGKARRRIRHRASNPLTDAVSVIPWLMSQRLKPGKVLKTTTFTGNQIYQVTGKVGTPEQVVLPNGSHRAYPIEFTAVRPGRTRTFRMWMDAETRTPLRLLFQYRLIGEIDAVLASARIGRKPNKASGKKKKGPPARQG